MMAREKFYVVWQGVKPGIYSSWEECRLQVFGFENARYKSFTSLEEAKKAFNENPWKHLNSKKTINQPNKHQPHQSSGKVLPWMPHAVVIRV